MKYILTFIFISTFTLNAQAPPPPSQDEFITQAENFVKVLAAENFSQAELFFDKNVKKLLPEEKLQKLWEQLISGNGDYEKIINGRKEIWKNYNIVYVTTKFKNNTVVIKVVLDQDKKIAGFFFLPGQEKKYTPPSYVDTTSFIEKEIQFKTGKFIIYGTLTLPRNKKNPPLVILVHGSGPNDRDETIGPNKPFKDIAWGLATKGIAVLRYDKRTKTYEKELAEKKDSITVKEEVIDDVVSAFNFGKDIKEIDKERIYILGHSLGAMLIPWISKEVKEAYGFIMMAAPARRIENVIFEQFKYLYSLDGTISEEEQAKLDSLAVKIAAVKSNSLSLQTPETELPLNVPPVYWLSLKDYNQVEEAKKIKRRLLILQGTRDYQVTEEDFKIWEATLKGKKNVKLKLYPKLNHLFMAGEEKSVPDEYLVPSNVAEYVIEDIANWILSPFKK